jgi:DNA-binding NtrC family response regulator
VLSGLIAQAWPGNVRELRNTIERAIIVCEGDTILPRHVPPSPSLRPTDPGDGPDSVSFRLGTSLEDAEKTLILRTLAANGNNKTRAADVLGISLKTLHNKLKAYGSQ